MEPPCAQGAARRPPGSILTYAHAARVRRIDAPPIPVRDAAVLAAIALTVTGKADLWTLAVALGLADGTARTALVVALAGVATIARVGSATLADITGAQAVLGAAGFTGAAVAVAAAWTSAASLLFAARTRAGSIALGALAGALVAGPSPFGGIRAAGVWLVGVVVGGAVGRLLAPTARREPVQATIAVVLGVVAVCLGVTAGYR